MKKLLKPITWPLDLLYRLRTTYLFLTSREARRAVDAARVLDTDQGREMIRRLNEQFAALQDVRVKRHHRFAEVKLVVNTKSLEIVDEETALQVLSEAVVAAIMPKLRRLKQPAPEIEKKPAA